ncbi:MAG: MFS transporter [Candidatus Margulisiibacteriota bacterium]
MEIPIVFGTYNVIQLLTNASIYASSLFIPLMAKEFGASPFAIGLIVSAFYFAYFVSSYLFGVFSDRYGPKIFLQIGLFFSFLFFALQILAKDLWTLLWMRALAGFSAGMFPAALEVYAFRERNGKIGKFAAYGSLGWALGSLLAGFLVAYNPIFIVSSMLFVVAFVLSLKCEKISPLGRAKLIPWDLFKRNLRIYVPYFLRAVGAQTIWAIFPLYLLSLGGSHFWIGIAYFVNAFSQFVIMQYIERFRNLYLFNIGLLCSVITFMAYALLPSFWYVFPVQVLLAFSFSTLQVGAHQQVLQRNTQKGSVVGILNSIVNFTAVIGPFLAGILLHFFGFEGVMWFAVMISLVSLISFTKVIE